MLVGDVKQKNELKSTEPLKHVENHRGVELSKIPKSTKNMNMLHKILKMDACYFMVHSSRHSPMRLLHFNYRCKFGFGSSINDNDGPSGYGVKVFVDNRASFSGDRRV